MSLLASCAAPFESNEDININKTEIDKKRLRNKTLKNHKPEKNNPLVENMMKQIHSNTEDDGDGDPNLGDFNPIAPPQSASMEKLVHNREPITSLPQEPVGVGDGSIGLEEFSGLPSMAAQQYYKKYVPYYDNMSNADQNNGNQTELLEKLNYMIQLLEEQHDEKTGHVTEELVLYCFLGVFVIFVVDSFARAGKYVR